MISGTYSGVFLGDYNAYKLLAVSSGYVFDIISSCSSESSLSRLPLLFASPRLCGGIVLI